MMNFGRDHARHVAWASAAQPRSDRNVLFGADRERNRITLHRSTQSRLPEHLAGFGADREEIAVEIAGECDSTSGGEYGREKRRALLDRPVLLQSAYIVCRQLSDLAPGVRHFEKPAVAGSATRILLEFHLATRHDHATLAQRDDQLCGCGMVAHRLPVVATLGARTNLNPLPDLLLEDVAAVRRFARLGVDVRE